MCFLIFKMHGVPLFFHYWFLIELIENTGYTIQFLFNPLRFSLWPIVWSISTNVPCVERTWFLCVVYMHEITLVSSNLLTPNGFIFYLSYQFWEGYVKMSLCDFGFLFSCSSSNFFFMYFKLTLLGTHKFRVTASW